ncbi:hypothetical protein LguiB_008207 [Lonicera macranthoides]
MCELKIAISAAAMFILATVICISSLSSFQWDGVGIPSTLPFWDQLGIGLYLVCQ